MKIEIKCVSDWKLTKREQIKNYFSSPFTEEKDKWEDYNVFVETSPEEICSFIINYTENQLIIDNTSDEFNIKIYDDYLE